MIYQPIVGLHANVAQVDFISMYPAIIIKGNISPEVPLPDGIVPACEELGVVPLTLKPLYEKRVALKLRGASNRKDSRLSRRDSARASALKWLLVVCFGFLGYKNARFGRIEAHEAVTNGGREVLLRAKEVAESLGCEVLHMYVDALWLKKPGAATKADFQDVLNEISLQTGLGVSLDGIYRWVAFLPSQWSDGAGCEPYLVFPGWIMKCVGSKQAEGYTALDCRNANQNAWMFEPRRQCAGFAQMSAGSVWRFSPGSF